ncbi:MAG: hypothetical protein U0234_01895 [Sandaracinus sp.]
MNARLDAVSAKRLDEIRARTHASVNQVLVRAIERYAESLAGEPPRSAYEIFRETGFVRCAEAERDLASDVKSHLDFGHETKTKPEPKTKARARCAAPRGRC